MKPFAGRLGDLEAAIGIEPMNKGFADLCLTTWLRRRELGFKPANAPTVYLFRQDRLFRGVVRIPRDEPVRFEICAQAHHLSPVVVLRNPISS